MDLHERLLEARKRAGFATAREAAEAIGVPYPTYAGHENGSSGFRANKGAIYARRFKIRFEWLMRGTGPIDDNEDIPAAPLEITLLTWISAGAMSRDDIADEALGKLRVAGLPKGDWIALKVEGDSMDRISPPESIILVNRADKALVTNGCYIIADENGDATYKRFRPNPMRFEPVSTNDAHEPIFPEQEPFIVGRVKRTMLDM